MKYINKNNNRVAELIEENPKSKMVTLKYVEDGKLTGITTSTFKRWWKKVEEETELVPIEQVSEAVPESLEEVIPVQKKDKDVNVKEITKQGKKKSLKIKDNKEKNSSVKSMSRDELRNKVVSTLEETGLSYTHPDNSNLEFLIEDRRGKKSIAVYLGSKKAVLLFKLTSVPEDARPDRVRNCPFSHAFDIYPDKMDKMVKLLQGRR